MEHIFRIVDFNVYDDEQSSFEQDSSDEENKKYKDKKELCDKAILK